MKIPEDRKPYEVIINGVKKTYEAGATVSDDASVKEIIDNEALFPPEAPETDKPFNIPIPAPGSTVVANPTLAGTEDSLTGIEVDGTKYAVGGGSGGGVLVVTKGLPPTLQLDKTWQEIYDASCVGIVIIKDTWEDGTTTEFVTNVENQSGTYAIETTDSTVYSTNSASGYPAFDDK